MDRPCIAIIGSFRKHNAIVQKASLIFRNAGIIVSSPIGENIIDKNIPFVRFTSDAHDWSDPSIQSLALHRILRAQLVYVIAPAGYVGRTTCYEIGRIVQANKPIYFSEKPDDLPIFVPNEFVVNPDVLAEFINTPGWIPVPLYRDCHDFCAQLERELQSGTYRQD